MQQLDLFETTHPQKYPSQQTQPSRRIVILDGYIVAQFYSGPRGIPWWTLYKGRTNDESDYAVWQESEGNLKTAIKLTGESDPLIIRSDLHPIQHKGGWTTGLSEDLHIYPDTPEGYRRALRELACSIE